ncbi:MAG: exodeoxyribonuclease III [Rhizobiales bacterium]|nr:exodeoxyribonuclease III [Hyphomicrobiales bacterium]
MQIATWNINGIKARLETLQAWLHEASPDVVCLQEIKSVDEGFPAQPFEDLGYNVATHGQKGFNGVAILSKRPFDELIPRLPGDDEDEQARYLEAVIPGDTSSVRVASIYLPNGNPVDSLKYPYKLAWMDRLIDHARHTLSHEEPLVLAGDYNVIPQAEDARKPDQWINDALFLPSTRQKFRELVNLGFTDALRATSSAGGEFTFWDYQAGAWQRNNGIRIDHHLLSPQAADRLTACRIDKHVREWEKPSDHVPVVIELSV